MNDLQLMYLINGDLATITTSEIVDMKGFLRAASDPQVLKVSIGEQPVGGTAVTIALQHSDVLDFSAPKTAYTSGAIDVSTVVTGMILEVPVPVMQRYSRVVITKTGTFTAGKINIYIGEPEEFGWAQLEAAQA